MSILLNSGIGDTIRVSLTPQPDGDRREEVYVAQQIYSRLELELFHQRLLLPGLWKNYFDFFSRIGAECSISCARLHEGLVG